MAIIRVPLNKTTIQSAVDAAAEGDVIQVRKGVYNEEVIVRKNSLCIVADDGDVFVTGGRLTASAAAFRIADAAGVEIRGFQISGFMQAGIVIQGGGRHRIVGNVISDCLFDGIAIVDSCGNLVWNNRLKQCGCTSISLLSLHGECSGNRLIGNTAHRSGFGALCVVSLFKAEHNDLIGNAIDYAGYGLSVINAANAILLDNTARRTAAAAAYAGGEPNTGAHIIIENELEQSGAYGARIAESTNSYAADNTFRANKASRQSPGRARSGSAENGSASASGPHPPHDEAVPEPEPQLERQPQRETDPDADPPASSEPEAEPTPDAPVSELESSLLNMPTADD